MFKTILLAGFLITGFSSWAQDTIKVMVYNLLEFPSAFPEERAELLKLILDEYEPDIFMVCELETQEGANQILNVSLNDEGNQYSRFSFVANQSSDSELQQLLFYRHAMFTAEFSETIVTEVRDINRYRLKVNTADQQTDPLFLEFFVAHLKSSQGTSNQNFRLDMVTLFTDKLATMDPNSYVFFAGDLNVYTSNEPAYQELLDPSNAISMADPLNRPGAWNANIGFQDIHTQSTRISSGPFGAGAGGGLDDRFDFIMISENMLADPKMKYVPETYKSFGNNGNCFDNNINSPDCTGGFSQQLRDRLYNMSDHLPVVMKMETNKDIILNSIAFDQPKNCLILKSTAVKDVLEFQMNCPEEISFMVYNAMGQKILAFNLEKSKNKTVIVSQLPEGMYYVKTDLPGGKTFKFLKFS